MLSNREMALFLKYLSKNVDIFHVSQLIGYANSRTFRVAFKNRFGIMPSSVRKEFNESTQKMNSIDKYLKKVWKVK